MAKVNLDALIPREDFEATGQNYSGNLFSSLAVSTFESGLFYPFLRKPDFQRETNEWDPIKICDFLESYINGDLIPSIILWRSSSGYYFVIDGAHRLSALVSWIQNDYGDGKISQNFYEGNILEEHKIIADETRRIINRKIGSYEDIKASTSNTSANPQYVKFAQNLGAYQIQVQWVQGDALKAEHSFFKINQQGVQVNNTEIKLLESRKKGNCIASRAIKSAGKGHKYWSDFSAENQKRIQELSSEINLVLFTPPLKTPVKTTDIPIAGKISSAQTLPLILDFVNIVNNIHSEFKDKINDDKTGEETIKYLQKVRKVVWRINSVHASSLGLHPIVYFYSPEGRHKPASFYAITSWLIELENKNLFKEFIKIRSIFESLLIKYDYLIQEINRKHRYAIKSYPYIKEFFMECMSLLLADNTIDETIKEVIKKKNFNYLKIDQTKEDITSLNFSSEKKSAVFIREALNNPVKCKICNGLIHQNSITIDHVERKEDGGLGAIENGQLAHPYCNTTFKN